ncbi:MAG: MFS transporter [Deltaproteobacteria bacterium]|nr:MFS transporter [Deltaproteobacteria bacterium]
MSLGAFNDNFFRQALISSLAFGALGLTNSEKSILGSLATGLMILPFFLFSSLAGQLADKRPKSSLVKISKLAELVFMCLAAVLFAAGQIYALLFVLFLMGLQSAFFGPLKYGLLPEVLEEENLIAGNGLVEGATFFAIVLGTMAGSYLVTKPIGPTIIMPVGLVLVAGIGFLLAYKQPPSVAADPKVVVDPQIWRSTWEIIRSAKKKDELWLSILAISWFWAMGSILLTQLPVLAATVIGGTPAVSTALVTILAFGVAVGSVVVQWLLKGRVSASLVPITAVALTISILCFSHVVGNVPWAPPQSVTLNDLFTNWTYLPIAIFCFLVSAFGGVFVVPLNAILQHRADPKERARVIAANNIINSLFMVVASLLVMLLISLGLTIAHVFLLVAVSSVLTTILTLYFLPHTALKQILRVLLFILYRPKIKGLENLKDLQTGPVLVIPNHTSFADVAFLVAYFPRRLSFAIDLFRAQSWWVKLCLNFYTAIPINPSQPLAARDIIEALERGDMLVIFPEGRLTITGGLMKIYDGPALIASHIDCRLLPVIFQDLEYTRFGRLRNIRRNRPKKLQVSMTVMAPVTLKRAAVQGENKREHRRKLTNDIYDIMANAYYESRDVDQNLYNALLKASRRWGADRVIIEDASRVKLTYKKIIAQSRVIGRILCRDKSAGDNVAVMLPNSNVLAAIVFGLWAGGKTVVMLNYSQGRQSIEAATKVSNTSMIVTSRKFVKQAKLEALIENLGCEILYLEDLKITFFQKLLGLTWRGSPSSIHSVAAVLFTSGSEGLPKGVALSHRNMLSDIWQARSLVEINEDDVFFNAMPAFHAFGLNVGIVLPLVSGLTLYCHPSPLHVKAIPELIYDTKATVIIGSDTFASAWGRNAHTFDFNKVRFMLLGAEKLKQATINLYHDKLNLKLFEGYGVTEAAPILAVGSKMRSKNGSVGHFVPGVEWKIEPISGLESGGLLFVRGPNLMMGYLTMANPGVVELRENNWYDTGDIVEVDDDGFVWIKGRYRRFAKLSGEMVSLAAIEEVAYSIWPEKNIAVLSFPDLAKGEKLVLVHEPSFAPSLEELRAALKNRGYSEFYCPKVTLAVKSFPITPVGKVNMPLLISQAKAVMDDGAVSRDVHNDSQIDSHDEDF